MDQHSLQQACELVDKLLHPPQQLFSDASGAVAALDISQQRLVASFQLSALSSMTGFGLLISQLIQAGNLPGVTLPEPQTHTPYIEEVSEGSAALTDQRNMQVQLMAKGCLLAGLYAEDSAFLTPWTNHQLDVASRSIMHKLSEALLASWQQTVPQATPGQPAVSSQEVSTTCTPDILKCLQPYLMNNTEQHDRLPISDTQGMSQCSDICRD